jgi:hypothetical protein
VPCWHWCDTRHPLVCIPAPPWQSLSQAGYRLIEMRKLMRKRTQNKCGSVHETRCGSEGHTVTTCVGARAGARALDRPHAWNGPSKHSAFWLGALGCSACWLGNPVMLLACMRLTPWPLALTAYRTAGCGRPLPTVMGPAGGPRPDRQPTLCAIYSQGVSTHCCG